MYKMDTRLFFVVFFASKSCSHTRTSVSTSARQTAAEGVLLRPRTGLVSQFTAKNGDICMKNRLPLNYSARVEGARLLACFWADVRVTNILFSFKSGFFCFFLFKATVRVLVYTGNVLLL